MKRLCGVLALALLLSGCAYGYGDYNYGNGPAPGHSGMPNGDIPGAAAGD